MYQNVHLVGIFCDFTAVLDWIFHNLFQTAHPLEPKASAIKLLSINMYDPDRALFFINKMFRNGLHSNGLNING